ncbi:MAG: hypothetical protein JOY90_14240 [Bradyrhizobium sp.]|uniref:hypothetical protein n=1 Tax=Bradyrhizobium sp. TaxID=376 RepID=UPI001D312210|nr:hypothetical protein [Bradyrhizobium sp.]MBV9561589.1 hypothetical protein [Bradyrhizobium sp.]
MAVNVAEPPEGHQGFSLPDSQSLRTYVALVPRDDLGARHRSTIGSPASALFDGPSAAAFAGACLGCMTTLALCAVGIPPAIASALATTLLCGQLLIIGTTVLLPGEFFSAIYGGTFAGMTPVLWLIDKAPDRSVMPAIVLFVSLSLFCSLAFAVVAAIDNRSVRRLAHGYGGRSGAIATAACLLFVELASLFGADNHLFRAARTDLFALGLAQAIPTCAACTMGMFATLLALRRPSMMAASPAERTFLASSVAVISLMILRLGNPDDAHLPEAFYAGCFLGMSTLERLRGWLQLALGAIILTAMLLAVRALLPGIGGGLGLAAFVTVAALAILRQAASPVVRAAPQRVDIVSAGALVPLGASLVPIRAGRSIGSGTPLSRGTWGMIANSIAALLAVGYLALPGRIALQGPVSDPAEPVVEAPDASFDELAPVTSAFGADAGNAGRVTELGSRSRSIMDPEHDGLADGGEVMRTNLAMAAPEETAPVPVGGGTRVEDTERLPGKLLRELLRWQVAHLGAPRKPQPAKKRHSRAAQFVDLLTPGQPPVPPRPVRRAAVAEPAAAPAMRPVHARRPVRAPDATPALDQ